MKPVLLPPRTLPSALALTGLLIFAGCCWKSSATAQEPPELFSSTSIPTAETGGDIPMLRTRGVNVRFDLLGGFPPAALILNLFPDAVYTWVIESIQNHPSGSRSWTGHVEGIPQSRVVLVVQGQTAQGTISLPQARYQIRFVKEGLHAVDQLNVSEFPREGHSIEVPPPGK